MKTRQLFILLGAFLIGTVGLTGTTFAQGGGGGGGGGGAVPPDYGDLIVLYRDVTGVPILDTSSCQQPIAFPANVGCPDEGLIDLGDALVVPTDSATCAILPDYATCVEEADFGRTNLSRATDKVLASQLDDVIVNLAIADCTSLDPAGRMVYSRYVGDELMTGTIDSPLQNLAVYKQLMRSGDIGVDLPQGATALDTAARGFGAAMDKAGAVNIDLLVYLNEIMGLTDPAVDTILDKICIDIKQEVMGNVEYVQKCFLDYGSYGYDRTTNFGGPLPAGLPSPAYIPEDAPLVGWFEFLMDTGGGTFAIVDGSIMTAVFLDATGYTGGNIGGFAQLADDTREVINFMHTYAVPATSATALTCTPTPDPTDSYDLSISERSGLQVPKQIVATTEGREFIVSVANAGPDVASGTLTVTAVTSAGGDVLVDGLPGPFVYEFAGLLPGMTHSETKLFTIGEPHVAAKIVWTAVVAPVDVDPNMGNNAVSATSNVRVTGGGGR